MIKIDEAPHQTLDGYGCLWYPLTPFTADKHVPHRGLEDASDHIPETKVCQSPKWTAAGAPSQKGAASRFQKNVGETQRLCNQSAGSRADTAEATKVDG